MTARRTLAEVAPGEALPPIGFHATQAALVAYAAATWDFHRVHYDAAFAAASGLKAPIMDGQMVGALLARLVTGWAGPGAFLRRLAYRQRGTVFVEERITLSGVVTGIENGLVLCRLDVHKQDGTEVVRDATAAVELPPP